MWNLRKSSGGADHEQRTTPADVSTAGVEGAHAVGAHAAIIDDPAHHRIRAAADLAVEMRQTGGKHRLDA